MKKITNTLSKASSKPINRALNIMMGLALSSASINLLAEPFFSQKSYEVKNSSEIKSNISEERSAQNSTSISTESSAKSNEQDSEYSDAQLEQMLAPVALYPDSLLTHILIAATYPLEVVQAERWLSQNKNKDLNTEQLLEQVKQENWDPSVQALIPFPNVIDRMSKNLDWTQQLGEAFLQSESSVLASIQSLRNKALEAGSLKQMDNVNVSYEDSNIVIQPIEREVVYVPYYDTRVIYGDWHWRLNPPIFWVNKHHHYRPHHGLFSWNAGVRLSFNVFFGAFHWRDHHVVVHHRDKHRGYRNNSYDRPSKRWQHDRKHRRGVVYRNAKLNKNFNKKTHNKPYNSIKKNIKNNRYDKKGRLINSVAGRRVVDKHQRIKKHLGAAKIAHQKGKGKIIEKGQGKNQRAQNYRDKKRVHNTDVNSAHLPKNKYRNEIKKGPNKQASKKLSNKIQRRELKLEGLKQRELKIHKVEKAKSTKLKSSHVNSGKAKKHQSAENNRKHR